MKPATDYIRHAARFARTLQPDAALGGRHEPGAAFATAPEEIGAGVELVGTRA